MAIQYDDESTVQDTPAGLTVAAAARALGTSKEAIRQRIRRGTLTATKVDGEWHIFLDHQPVPPTPYMLPNSAPLAESPTPNTIPHGTPAYTKPSTPYSSVDAPTGA